MIRNKLIIFLRKTYIIILCIMWVCLSLGLTSCGNKTNNNSTTESTEGDVLSNVYDERYIGEWYNLEGQPPFMTITYEETQGYIMEIHWSTTAFESISWYLNGIYSEEKNGIVYTGILTKTFYSDDGTVTEENSEAGGLLYFKDNGLLYWDDWKENYGHNCVFEKDKGQKVYDWYIENDRFCSQDGNIILSFYTQNDVMLCMNIQVFEAESSVSYDVEPSEIGENGELIYKDGYGWNITYYPEANTIYFETGEGLYEGMYFPITEEIIVEQDATENVSDFKEDWYVEHCYYIDSNGNYFVIKHSDVIFQIEIAEVDVFNVELYKYKIENDSEYGNVYVYYDMDSYELIKYYPQLNNTIVIETSSGKVTCTNISQEEYLEAEREYANSQLEGFEEEWYKDKYLSYNSYEHDKTWMMGDSCYYDGSVDLAQYMGYRKIIYMEITDMSDIFTLELDPVFDYMSELVVVDFFSDEYEIDYEKYCYAYETTNSEGVKIYLEYFPKDSKIRVYDEYESIGGAAVKERYYFLITEDEIEELSTIY